MKIAMLSPIAWRTPPRHYGPWENIVSLLTEELIEKGVDVTLFASGDSETKAKHKWIVNRGYEEDKFIIPKVWECLHISELFENADNFDIIHNHFDYLPLTYSGLVSTPVLTTIHGFSSPKILPVYKKYDNSTYYVAISNADKSPQLNYIDTVYHGINLSQFSFQEQHGEYLLFFGRIHPEKGVKEAIEIAIKTNLKLIIAGIIQDKKYFHEEVEPRLNKEIIYLGNVDPLKRNELLGKALALLHLINFDEPFGLSVIEAMACGTPVVAVNRGSMSEIIINNKNGFLIDHYEEAIDIIENKIINIDRHECRKTVEKKFTSSIMADKYIEIYKNISQKNQRESLRPWGYYKVLSNEDNYKAKEIVIYPGGSLSLQRHQYRREHWHFIEGKCTVTLNNNKINVKNGDTIDIPVRAIHRIENKSTQNVIFIEIQTGTYFGEDDIERIEDEYGRK